MNINFIYKICSRSELQVAKNKGQFLGSTKDLKDGFIHLSTEQQVEQTLKKYYLDQKDLILLKVDTSNLHNLLWEQSSDGQIFPHLYSLLDLSNVIDEFEISLKNDGSYILTNNL